MTEMKRNKENKKDIKKTADVAVFDCNPGWQAHAASRTHTQIQTHTRCMYLLTHTSKRTHTHTGSVSCRPSHHDWLVAMTNRVSWEFTQRDDKEWDGGGYQEEEEEEANAGGQEGRGRQGGGGSGVGE